MAGLRPVADPMPRGQGGAMSEHRADVVVVGLGPGGEALAGGLARAGWSVVAVQDGLVGGECPYWGCVPSKAMVRASDALGEARRVNRLAGQADVVADWLPVAHRIREVTSDWDDSAAVERLEAAGVRLVRGRGRLTSPTTVAVGGAGDQEYAADRAVVLAAGTRANIPPVSGLAATPYWTNHELVEATALPTSMVVLGGGAVGCELTQVVARFGVHVCLVEPGERLLGNEEPEAGELVARAMRADGVEVHTGARAERVTHDGRAFTVTLQDGTELTGERLLVATGREVDMAGLGADRLGLPSDARTFPVDGRCRVVVDGEALGSTFAIGDVSGRGAFTHVATHQAGVVRDVLLGRDVPADAGLAQPLPRVTFTDPEVGAVGMTAQQARERWGDAVHVASKSLSDAATRGYLQGPGGDGLVLLVEHDGVLVGGTTAGPYGGEVLGALSVAVQARVPVADLRRHVWAYPTFHRGISAVLDDLPS